jgi:hypothetical protein
VAEPAPPVIDPAELRQILASAGLPATTGRYQAEFVGRFSNDVWRLDMEDGGRLIAKMPYRPARAHDHPDVERAFFHAMRDASDDQTDLPLPDYVGEVDGILLLVFVPLQPFDFATGASNVHATRAMDALADWHAAWWQRPIDADWLPRLDDPDQLAAIQANYDLAWQAHGRRLVEFAPEFRPTGEALIGRLAATLTPMAEPATLLHGDAHAENLPLTDSGRVLMLDWQEPRIGNPGYDLAVFTTMSFRQRDRPAAERMLMTHYLARLEAKGCHWPDPWIGYRLGLLRRVARLVEIADLDFPSLPWVFRRAVSAMLDHQSADLIR